MEKVFPARMYGEKLFEKFLVGKVLGKVQNDI
jgi:hypothetical protein